MTTSSPEITILTTPEVFARDIDQHLFFDLDRRYLSLI
jgi:hypothetical protein